MFEEGETDFHSSGAENAYPATSRASAEIVDADSRIRVRRKFSGFMSKWRSISRKGAK